MNFYGLEFLQAALLEEHYFFKLVANDRGVYFFPHSLEHREARQPALRYEDDYAGNALAAIVKPRRIDFRFHRDFSAQRVRNIAERILSHPEIPWPENVAVTYQGRSIL